MRITSPVAALGLALLAAAPAAQAASVYPTNQCVSSKQKAAGTYCKSVLGAQAKWNTTQDAAKRDASIAKAGDKLDKAWLKAEEKSLKAGVDCVDTTLTSDAAASLVDSAAGAILADVNDGLNLGVKSDASCGAKIVKAAGVDCSKILVAQSAFIKALAKDPTGEKRDGKIAKASQAFTKTFLKEVEKGCPTTATAISVGSAVDGVTDAIVTNTIVSPNVDDSQFTTISPTGPIQYQGKTLSPTCMDGSPYSYFVKRGTVNKVLYYYQGGGACWESTTCGLPVCDTNVTPGDNPNGATSGFFNLSNP
ncbi:MAG TPA: hypothetical protein VGR62_21335, partial [Candidatus Binatia bacterium]|nr:hypothetical protein [Candidatus Binatia bacterium]